MLIVGNKFESKNPSNLEAIDSLLKVYLAKYDYLFNLKTMICSAKTGEMVVEVFRKLL